MTWARDRGAARFPVSSRHPGAIVGQLSVDGAGDLVLDIPNLEVLLNLTCKVPLLVAEDVINESWREKTPTARSYRTRENGQKVTRGKKLLPVSLHKKLFIQ